MSFYLYIPDKFFRGVKKVCQFFAVHLEEHHPSTLLLIYSRPQSAVSVLNKSP